MDKLDLEADSINYCRDLRTDLLHRVLQPPSNTSIFSLLLDEKQEQELKKFKPEIKITSSTRVDG